MRASDAEIENRVICDVIHRLDRIPFLRIRSQFDIERHDRVDIYQFARVAEYYDVERVIGWIERAKAEGVIS